MLAACGGGGGGGGASGNGGGDNGDGDNGGGGDGDTDSSLVMFSESEWNQVNTFSPLPPVPPHPTNQFADSADAATLGQQYFFDARFSGPLTHDANDGGPLPANGSVNEVGTVSCARCHQPDNGFTDGDHVDGSSLAAEFTGRNAPTLLNASYYPFFFWAGRKDSQWSQALAPTESPVEMNFNRVQLAMVIRNHYMPNSPNPPNPDHFDVFKDDFTPAVMTDILDNDQTYLEDKGFPAEGALPDFPTQGRPGDSAHPDAAGNATYDGLTGPEQEALDRVFTHWAKAIAAYERLLVSKNSAFDQWVEQGNADGPADSGGYGANDRISDAAKRGFKVFVGAGQCNVCHRGPNFTDHFDDGTTMTAPFHNIGVEQTGTHIPDLNTDQGLDDAIEPLMNDPFAANREFSDDTTFGSMKLDLVADLPSPPDPRNQGEFKTTALRSIAQTAPYMHTGQLATLTDVVTFYINGGGDDAFHAGQNELNTLSLSAEDTTDLVAFLRALDGEPLPATLTTAPTLPP